MIKRFPSLAALLPALPAVVLAADMETQQPAVLPTFPAASNVVMVDVVVRDKQGDLVRDLAVDDFQVYEDGVRQQITQFVVIGSRTPVEARPTTTAFVPQALETHAPEARQAPKERSVLALVFDSLSPQGRKIARDAALSFVENERQEGDLVGVFLLDLRLHVIQDFTTSAESLTVALERVAGKASLPSQADANERRLGLSDRLTRLNTALEQMEGGAQSSSAPLDAASVAAVATEAALTDIALRMEETFAALERDQRGFASTNGLLAVVNALRIMPGRKTVVFFSEGFAIPVAVQEQIRSIIHAANRANVAVYTMDAAGLRAISGQRATRNELDAAAALRRSQLASPIDAGRDGPMIKALERNEELLRTDPASGLGVLAEETGGFHIRDTNDLNAGLRRINEEMRFYYLLSYSPANESFDGRFREISVKVKRPGARVQARKGYFGVRSQGPVLAYETAALAILEKNIQPSAFLMFARAFSFPDPKRPGLTAVTVEIPGSAPTFRLDDQRRTCRYDFSIVARIRHENGEVIDKLSQRYLLEIPKDSLASFQQQPLLFYRETQLPKGRYVVETAAYDSLSANATVRLTELEVPDATNAALQLGSVVLIARVEQIPKNEVNPAHPLQYGEILVYPNLGQPFRMSTYSRLGVMLRALMAPGSSAPAATVELWQDGRRILRTRNQLSAPDAQGQSQTVWTFPLERLRPGDAELRVLLADDKSNVTRSASFRISE